MKLIIDISRDDYADFNKFHYLKYNLKRTILYPVLALIFILYYVNREGFNLTSTLITPFIFVIVYVLSINRTINRTKKIPNNDGAILGEKEYEFSDDIISYKTNNAEGSLNWSTVLKLEESTNAFYLYMDTNMALIVPKRVFKDQAEEEAFKNIVKGKIKSV